jgi:hypothetical protein
MKLSDVFEDMWDQSYLKGLLDEFGQDEANAAIDVRRKKPNHKFVGAGANAYVGKTDDEHNMDSVERTAPDHEPGVVYMQWIQAHPNLRNNPFFPRVLSRDSESPQHMPTYHIERLVHMTDKHFDHPDMVAALWSEYIASPPPDNPTASMLAQKIEQIVLSKRIADFRDPMLRAAVVQLITFAEEHEYQLDLHSGNMMLRVTGKMPQLVFSDPFML